MERPFNIHHMDHIVFHVRDLDRSLAFYRLFDDEIKPPVRPGGNTPVRLGPTTRVLLMVDPNYVPPKQGNLNHVSLELETPGSIEDVIEYVKAHGGEPFDGPREMDNGTFRQFRVNDPDGNEFEIRVHEHGKPA